MAGVVSACDAETSSESAGGGEHKCSTAHGTAWTEPASYAYTLHSTTQTLVGTFRIQVQNGTVTKVTGLDEDGQQQAREQHVEVPTLGELVSRLRQARCDHAETAAAEYAADGHPVWISLDWDKNAIDDEALYRISSYQPHPGQWAAAMAYECAAHRSSAGVRDPGRTCNGN
jgi:hypothetical protein